MAGRHGEGVFVQVCRVMIGLGDGMNVVIERMKELYWTCGPEASEWWAAILRAIPGRIGIRMRASVYRRKLGSCGVLPIIQRDVVLGSSKLLQVGDRLIANRLSQIEAVGGIRVGNCVMGGSSVRIWSINHRSDDLALPMLDQRARGGAVVIKDDVWLCAGAVVLRRSHTVQHGPPTLPERLVVK